MKQAEPWPFGIRAGWIPAALAIWFWIFLANASFGQDISISFGDEDSLAARALQIFLLVTLLSLVPGIAVMVTSFPFMVTVLAILRQGLGLQQSPPNMLIVSLALFLTYFVMEPVFTEAWATALKPAIDGQIDLTEAARISIEPFRTFMSSRTNPGTLAMLTEIRTQSFDAGQSDQISLSTLIPSFLLSEIGRAFQVGFLILLPFLIIDLVVAAVLMSMGMMMVPPVIVSLPFKLAFFVVADGWTLLTRALVEGYL